MAIRKSDLYQSIWDSCDELRGGMDASQYKDYVLVLLFVKYVTDRYRNGGVIAVPEGGSFEDMVAVKGQKDIGERINVILSTFAEANGLTGVVDGTDFNDPTKLGSGQEMVDRLTNLVAIFENPALDFASNRADGDDLLGDAYEYLMRHFATESGKAKGQFYTPAEVSRILAAVVGVEQTGDSKESIYDPTCGSGSLLLKAHEAARKATGLDLAIYGQEKDNATANLAKMNMVLHDAPTAVIEQGDTLANPKWRDDGRLKRFEYVVANPPFSTKSWRSGFKPEDDDFDRFELGIPPTKNGDYAFLLHILASLKSTGTGAVILPHGVLFRGHSEAQIRQNLVDRGYINAIIGLPPNLFYGTGIPACIVVIDKRNATGRNGIFMIDASRGFAKDGAKNRLRERDIHRIVDVYRAQKDVPRYSRMVSNAEISSEANNYNLNLSRYIDASEPDDMQDIEAHLKGGIPQADIDALSEFWEILPSSRDELFEATRHGYVHLRIDGEEVGDYVQGHAEFIEFSEAAMEAFEGWEDRARKQLVDINCDTRPGDLITSLAEDLLQTFRSVRLIDEYGVYQRLMEYWDATMKDDVYLVSELDWATAAQAVKMAPKKKGEKNRPTPNFVVGSGRRKAEYRSELLPSGYLIERFLSEEQKSLDAARAAETEAKARTDELEEEHATADGLLSEVINEKGNITKGSLSTRLRELEEGDEEQALLLEYQQATDDLADARRRVKEATSVVTESLKRAYAGLDAETARSITVEEKWLDRVERGIAQELAKLSRELRARIEVLDARYKKPLPEIELSTNEASTQVRAHLTAMGFDE